MDSEGGKDDGVAIMVPPPADQAAAEVEKEKETSTMTGGETEMAEEDKSGGKIDLLMLNSSQLERLALLLRNREEPLMSRVVTSQQERAQYLRTVTDSHAQTLRLLEDSTALAGRYAGGDSRRMAVSRDVHDYVVYGLNACLQNVRNPCMRIGEIGKLREHYDELAGALADPAADADALAAEAAEYKDAMWQYCYTQRSATARAYSRAYSRALRLEGIRFDDLLRRHQLKLGHGGNFEDLDDDQKLEVYNSIIDESGRARVSSSSGRKISAAAKKTWKKALAIFMSAAGNLAMDVFTADHDNLETVLKNSVTELALDLAGFAVEVAVSAAVTSIVAKAGAGILVTSLAGFVAGAVAGLIFGIVSGAIIDSIFQNPRQVPRLDDLKFYTAVMPDGMALAYSLTHHG